MKLGQVLEEMEKLLSKWGLRPSDWILVSQYAYRLLGYEVKVRNGHFNILVDKTKIPWFIEEGVEIHPPHESIYEKQFDDFISLTGFDFDINLATQEEFNNKKGKYILYSLANGKQIRVQKPEGAIKEFEKLLALSTKEGFGVERLDKDIFYIKDMLNALSQKDEPMTAELFRNLLAKYIEAKKNVKQKKSNEKSISGIVASKGKVVGRAVVVKDISDAEKMTDGDILVTQMTSPSVIAIIPKIAAIVTDQGGMLSHAAILAREIGVPCVVGTQIATTSIATGDILEVDADKGVVKKLNEKKF